MRENLVQFVLERLQFGQILVDQDEAVAVSCHYFGRVLPNVVRGAVYQCPFMLV